MKRPRIDGEVKKNFSNSVSNFAEIFKKEHELAVFVTAVIPL
jgi:hypothetical protein